MKCNTYKAIVVESERKPFTYRIEDFGPEGIAIQETFVDKEATITELTNISPEAAMQIGLALIEIAEHAMERDNNEGNE